MSKNRSFGSSLCSLYKGISNNEVQSILNKTVKSTIFILFYITIVYSFITYTTNPRKMHS